MPYKKGQHKVPKRYPTKNKYLGTKVDDIPPRGFSHSSEVSSTLKAIELDYIQGRIDRGKLNQRTLRLRLIVKQDRDFAGKRKSIFKDINALRSKYGMKTV